MIGGCLGVEGCLVAGGGGAAEGRISEPAGGGLRGVAHRWGLLERETGLKAFDGLGDTEGCLKGTHRVALTMLNFLDPVWSASVRVADYTLMRIASGLPTDLSVSADIFGPRCSPLRSWAPIRRQVDSPRGSDHV